jgi:hypothetical protein
MRRRWMMMMVVVVVMRRGKFKSGVFHRIDGWDEYKG